VLGFTPHLAKVGLRQWMSSSHSSKSGVATLRLNNILNFSRW
jgi:hypothetical protein